MEIRLTRRQIAELLVHRGAFKPIRAFIIKPRVGPLMMPVLGQARPRSYLPPNRDD